LAARAVACVAGVVLHACVSVVTEGVGQLGFERAFDQGFGDLFEGAGLAGQVLGCLVGFEELVDQLWVNAGRAGQAGLLSEPSE